MIERSDEIKELAIALARAQGEFGGAKKNKLNVNQQFRHPFADLWSVLDAVRDPLSSNGLSVVQIPVTGEPGAVTLWTCLLHSSGEWIAGTWSVPVQLSKKEMATGSVSPQRHGSALTYLRRYALMAILGVAPEDDDGELATSRDPHEHRSAHPRRESRTPSPRRIPEQDRNRKPDPSKPTNPGRARLNKKIKRKGFLVKEYDLSLEDVHSDIITILDAPEMVDDGDMHAAIAALVPVASELRRRASEMSSGVKAARGILAQIDKEATRTMSMEAARRDVGVVMDRYHLRSPEDMIFWGRSPASGEKKRGFIASIGAILKGLQEIQRQPGDDDEEIPPPSMEDLTADIAKEVF